MTENLVTRTLAEFDKLKEWLTANVPPSDDLGYVYKNLAVTRDAAELATRRAINLPRPPAGKPKRGPSSTHGPSVAKSRKKKLGGK